MKSRERSLLNLCRFMEVLLLAVIAAIIFLSLWFICHPVERGGAGDEMFDEVLDISSGGELSPEDAVLMAFDTAAILLVLAQVYLFFHKIKSGELFTSGQINSLKIIGMTLIVTWLVSFLLRLLLDLPFYYPEMDYTLILTLEVNSIMQLLCGIGILVFSHIMRLAKALKDENDLVI